MFEMDSADMLLLGLPLLVLAFVIGYFVVVFNRLYKYRTYLASEFFLIARTPGSMRR